MQPFAEVVETLGGQGVVVVLPRELSLDIASGVEGLARLDDKQVLGVDIGVLGKVEVLLGHEDTLAEEVLWLSLSVTQILSPQFAFLQSVVNYLVDLLAVGLGNQHRGGLGREVDVEEGQIFGVKVPALKMDNFCGRKPYEKFEPSEWGGLEVVRCG